MSKVLYVSSNHPVLEYDDLTVFTDLGVDWFSTGIYINPQEPLPLCKRRSIDIAQNTDLAKQFYKDNPGFNFDPHLGYPPAVNLTKKFLDNFDIIIINNFMHFLTGNWEVLKDKKVFFRTYYYTDPHKELELKKLRKDSDLKVVRMFPQELNIPGNVGADYLIQNYVDGDEYHGWTGEESNILTFQNDMLVRLNYKDSFGKVVFDSYHAYMQVVQSHSAQYDLYGYNNRVPQSKGVVSWRKQKDLYKSSRCYFSLGSKPGPYTYTFLEAMSTGTPTINFGPKLGDYDHPWYKKSYIVPDIIEHGVDGFVSDDLSEITSIIDELLENHDLAKTIAENARPKILKRFGRNVATEQWREFFSKELA